MTKFVIIGIYKRPKVGDAKLKLSSAIVMSIQDVSKVPLHYTCTDSHLRDGALIRMRRMYLGKFIGSFKKVETNMLLF